MFFVSLSPLYLFIIVKRPGSIVQNNDLLPFCRADAAFRVRFM